MLALIPLQDTAVLHYTVFYMKTKKYFLVALFARFAPLLSAVLLVAFFAACAGTPRAGSAVWGGLGGPADPVPFMQDVRTGYLPSGLRYFILENSMPENRAFIRLAVNAGSLHEEDHEQGLAHFVEHMAFRGTERFPEAELINYLRSLGMRFGPELNAFVSFDRTVYMLEVPVETADDGTRIIPATALAIIDDWSRAVTFDPEATELERLVVIEEYRWRLGAVERIRRDWLPVLFRGSRFAERMPIGRLEIIETATVEHLKGFYRRWYQADNMAIIFVGDFDGAALEASLTEHFLIEEPATPTPQLAFDLPPPRRGNLETLVLTDPELTVTQVMVYFRRPRQPRGGDLASFRESIIDYLIRNMMSFRFADAAVNPETPFINASAFPSRQGYSSRFYVLSAIAKSERSEDTLEELLRAKESMRRYGFTETELTLASQALVSHYQRIVQERDRQGSGTFMNSLTNYFINRGGLPDFEWELYAIQQLLPGITARDINAAVRNYFASNDIQVFIFAPDAEIENLPSDERIRQMVRQRGRMSVQRPVERAVQDRLLPVTPEPGSVVSQTVDAETGAVIWELDNGARVILYQTENRNDEIILNAMARGGTVSVGNNISARLAVEMTQVSGLGPWSRPDLSRQLAARQATLSYSVGAYTRGFQGSSTTGDLQTLFEMLYLNFTDLRIDTEAVEAMMGRLRTSLALRRENPRTVFSDAINQTITSDHPYFRHLEIEDLSDVNINNALDFLRRGLNPADFTFVFVGNLTPELMAPYVETYLASIPPFPAEARWNSWADPGIVRPGRIERNVFRGIEDRNTIHMAWFAPAVFTEQLSLTTQVLNGYLRIKLNDEIRENLGGVYGISSSVGMSFTPRGEMSLRIQFDSNPARSQELSDAVLRLLNETATGTIDRTVFNNAVEALHQDWEVSMQNNSFIAQSFINSSAMMNLPLSRLHRRPQYINAVTPADIQGIAVRLLQNGPAKLVLFPDQQ